MQNAKPSRHRRSSLLDAATGLQLKGERWYSPDLGRFVSEDPIQDGSNWYAFATPRIANSSRNMAVDE